ncbi:hypothetical protein [Arcobacter sp. 15-2]|uniref:hypothetical protein n=1 Tax=Arcobacter sp. 15-2 TaxID=3374109 RepID=UPI00399C724D
MINRNNRIILLAVYAFLMLFSIVSQIDTITFIVLFAIIPITIFYIIKRYFKKKNNEREI